MIIKILGSGCKNCKKLYHNTILALTDLDIDATVIKITDFSEIAKYNTMQMPALVLDEKVISKGKVVSKEGIKKLIS